MKTSLPRDGVVDLDVHLAVPEAADRRPAGRNVEMGADVLHQPGARRAGEDHERIGVERLRTEGRRKLRIPEPAESVVAHRVRLPGFVSHGYGGPGRGPCAALCRRMAGAPGFEPGSAGIKTRCLTAWLRPNSRRPGRFAAVRFPRTRRRATGIPRRRAQPSRPIPPVVPTPPGGRAPHGERRRRRPPRYRSFSPIRPAPFSPEASRSSRRPHGGGGEPPARSHCRPRRGGRPRPPARRRKGRAF